MEEDVSCCDSKSVALGVFFPSGQNRLAPCDIVELMRDEDASNSEDNVLVPNPGLLLVFHCWRALSALAMVFVLCCSKRMMGQIMDRLLVRR